MSQTKPEIYISPDPAALANEAAQQATADTAAAEVAAAAAE